MKGTALLAALAVLGGCGSSSATGRPCTDIGTPAGVGLDIRPPLAAKIASATMRICVDGACHTPKIHLAASTTATTSSCPRNDRGAACAASAVPTGGKNGFASVPTLAKKPTQVTVVLRDASARRLLSRRLVVTPKTRYPNGPHCGGGGPQTGIIVENGRLRERP